MCEEEYFFVKIKKLILILTISKLCREFVEKAISRRQIYFSGEMSSSIFFNFKTYNNMISRNTNNEQKKIKIKKKIYI